MKGAPDPAGGRDLTGQKPLNSWKAIARYFNRDVTTVRRWERREGLPVRRLYHGKGANVYAFPAELELWRESRASRVRTSGAAGSRIHALAVLPLENLSHDPEQEYFADGMTDALITQLSCLQELRVVSRSSVIQFKGRPRPVPDVARLLNVDAVVEGTVQRSGGRVRITAQVVSADTGTNLWGRAYERELTDVLLLQSDVAQAIAQQVQLAITPGEHGRLTATRVVSTDAYESYLKGRFHLSKYTREGLEESLRCFDRAIALDSTFAPAYGGRASACDLLGTFFIGLAPPSAMRSNVVGAALKALDLDPHLAEAHTMLASARQQEWQWDEAEAGYRRAVALSPSDATAHLGLANFLSARGLTEEAVWQARHVRHLDPLSLQSLCALGVHLYLGRRYDEAIRHLQGVQELQPDHVWSLWHLGLALLEAGRFHESIEVLQRTVSVSDRSGTPLGSLAMAYGRAGQQDEAQRIVRELTALTEARYVPPAAFLHAYVGIGDRERAFTHVEEAFRERSYIMQFVKVLPLLDPLRQDQRFVELIRRVGLE